MVAAKDVPAATVIESIKATPGYWRNWNAVFPVFEERMPGIPFKVFVRKVENLRRKGLVHACCSDARVPHGLCRGDIHLPEECRGC